ncbi:hypothetical protein [Acidipropionibacterium jensenii]|uniref:hypothetical protein n=1 Tax=Acidipropionibacterium jensenii TaxID=1749 RepID=UPI00214CD552|nr:hypothetical protein [Acidipropionibacterium jensenii]
MRRGKDRRIFVTMTTEYLRNRKVSGLYRDAVRKYGRQHGPVIADQAVIAHFGSIAMCRDGLTDGSFYPEDVFRQARTRDTKEVEELLIAAGLWEPTGDDMAVHDYAAHQATRAEIERYSDAGRKGGKASGTSRTRRAAQSPEAEQSLNDSLNGSSTNRSTDRQPRTGQDRTGQDSTHRASPAPSSEPPRPGNVCVEEPPKKHHPGPDDFNQFWQAHPGKHDKDATRAAFARLIETGDTTGPELVTAARHYADAHPRNPTWSDRWLTRGEWEDCRGTTAPRGLEETPFTPVSAGCGPEGSKKFRKEIHNLLHPSANGTAQ